MRILSSNLVLLGRRRLRAVLRFAKLLLILPAALLSSCAKFPTNGGTQNTHLIFTMKVAGHIQDGSQNGESPYIYIVALYPSTDLFPTVQGPLPKVAQPWGNGFVDGNVTHFIQYGLGQVAPYAVYQFTTPDLLSFGVTGVPVSSTNPYGGNTIQFEIDMSQITPIGGNPALFQSILVNFLTMDRRPIGNDNGTKVWDALGDSRDPNSINDYVRIPLTSSRVFTNADFQDLEVANDVTPYDPNLDIVDWSVEVRRP